MRRRGHFPARGHTTWGVPAEGCSLGGPGPNAGGTFQKQNQASYACWGPAEGQPCAGDTGKVTPPRPPNRVSGPGRVPPALPGSAPLQEAAAGLPPSPARGGGGLEGPLEPESGMVEEFPERARERLGASARARRGPASGRGRGRGPRPAPQGRAQPRAARSDRPLPCQGFLCFALAFCALVQVAVWGVHSPSQVSAPPTPSRQARAPAG